MSCSWFVCFCLRLILFYFTFYELIIILAGYNNNVKTKRTLIIFKFNSIYYEKISCFVIPCSLKQKAWKFIASLFFSPSSFDSMAIIRFLFSWKTNHCRDFSYLISAKHNGREKSIDKLNSPTTTEVSIIEWKKICKSSNGSGKIIKSSQLHSHTHTCDYIVGRNLINFFK